MKAPNEEEPSIPAVIQHPTTELAESLNAAVYAAEWWRARYHHELKQLVDAGNGLRGQLEAYMTRNGNVREVALDDMACVAWRDAVDRAGWSGFRSAYCPRCKDVDGAGWRHWYPLPNCYKCKGPLVEGRRPAADGQ